MYPFVPTTGTPPYTMGTPIPEPSGTNPSAIAISPDGTTVYVANFTDATVSVIDTATKKVRATVPSGNEPVGIAVTPNGTGVWVTNQVGGGTPSISVINTATEHVVNTFSLPATPTGLAMSPDGSTAYVTDNDTTSILAIAVATTAISTIPVGIESSAIAVSPDGSTAYVASNNTSTVVAVELPTGTAETPSISVGSGPDGVAVEPSGANAWVTDFGTEVDFIDTTTHAVSSVLAGSQPAGVALEPDQAPQAALSVTPALVGSPTSFDASASTPGSSPIVSYHWIFGDGSSAVTATPTTTHTYHSGGTITASVTETDAAGTSTTQVFTGQTVSRNGGAQAMATATFVITSCATGTTSCNSSLTSKTQNVSVSGKKSAATKAKITILVSPRSLKVAGYPTIASTATLTDTGLTGSVDALDTVHRLPSVAGVQILYQPVVATPPPPTILKRCSVTLPPDPCYFSITESGGSVTVSLRFPGGDPKWRVAAKLPVITSFSPISGLPGKVVAITGTNLSEVTSVLFGTTPAKIDTRALTKLTVTVPALAHTGRITLKSLAGTVISTRAFTVT